MGAGLALLPRLVRSARPPLPPCATILVSAAISPALHRALAGATLIPDWQFTDLPKLSCYDGALVDERLAAEPDDEGWLRQLLCWLRPGARLFLALPFDPDRFGATDEAAGWRRRYTRADLHGLLYRVGCQVERIWVAPPVGAGRFGLLDRLGSRLDWGSGVAVRARSCVG
jgi:hypothetical protein